ncbi:hypothetical protein ABK040_000826 [Willaertia magna]
MKRQQPSNFQLLNTTSLFLCFYFLFSIVNIVNAQLTITRNQLSISNGESVTLNSNHLASMLNGQPSPSQVIYRVTQITNGQFRLLTNTNNNNIYTPITQFTQGNLNAGIVSFLHANNQQFPSYTLTAQDPVTGLISPDSTATITFSAFHTGNKTIGAPRPIFEADINPQTFRVTLRITVFKKVFTTTTNPEVNFNIGLSRKEQCTSSDFIRDFQLISSTNWYNIYELQTSLNQFLTNPNVQQVTNGPVIDIVTNMYATYMITQVTTWPGTNQQEVNCYQVVYSQRYVLSLALAITNVNFNVTGVPAAVLKPVKIFVNDFNKLELRVIVMIAGNPTINTWTVTGPYVFTVTDVIADTRNNATISSYLLALQSNVINGIVNFFGDYNLIATTNTNTQIIIPYRLQYLTTGGPIQQQLIFNTTALTFADPAFTIPKSQFTSSDTVNVRVDAPLSPTLDFKDLSPFNVVLCCFLTFTTAIPQNVDCRNYLNSNGNGNGNGNNGADFTTAIFINGTPITTNGLNTNEIPTPSEQNYGFQFNLPFTIRDNEDRTCFLTIESSFLPVDNSTSTTTKKRRTTVAVTKQVGSVTQKVISLVANGKLGDNKNNNGTNNNNNNNNGGAKRSEAMMSMNLGKVEWTVLLMVLSIVMSFVF